jgi:hypothetical protein
MIWGSTSRKKQIKIRLTRCWQKRGWCQFSLQSGFRPAGRHEALSWFQSILFNLPFLNHPGALFFLPSYAHI